VRFQRRHEQLDALRTDFGFADLTPQHRREILARETGHAVYLNRFRKALDEPNPAIRFRAAGDACTALQRRIGEFRGVSLLGPGLGARAPGAEGVSAHPGNDP
jgi:hypothetical protein